MKYLRFWAVFCTLSLWTGCSMDDPVTPPPPRDMTIGVSASMAEFTRADDGATDSLMSQGFSVWANYAYNPEVGEVENYFFDSCRYTDGWKFKTPHIWPSTATNFDFYALSPGIYYPEEGISDVMYAMQDSIFIAMSELNFYGYFDVMLAKVMGINYNTNQGGVTFEFEHLMTKVTLQVAFRDNLEFPFPNYWAVMELYGDKCSVYNVTSGRWRVEEALPDDFDIQEPNADILYNVGGADFVLTPSPEGSDLNYQTAGVSYILPQKYQAKCYLLGSVDNPDQCAEGNFELDLTGKAGHHVILKVTTAATGYGYTPKLILQTTDEEISEID